MGRVQPHPPAALFFGLLLSEGVQPDDVHARLEAEFGPALSVSEIWPFEHTEYYAPEMGPSLRRQFLAVDRRIDPTEIVPIKIRTNMIELELADEATRHRRVNIDPGYLTLSKVVLASTKDHAHRICLGQGIYAEVTLTYHRRGGFDPWPWTYPDYREERIRAWFDALRLRLKSGG